MSSPFARLLVLVVEDDQSVAQALCRGLHRYGFEVETAATGAEALAAAHHAEVILLDLGLPDADGLDICRVIRESSTVPIIVVSARSEETDRVVGLEIGADDYISKPFGVREVIARIRAVMRRANTTSPASDEKNSVPRLLIDHRAGRVHVDGTEVSLTAKEYALLSCLLEDPGALLSREQIMQGVWGTTWFGQTKTLDVHVAALRRKLSDVILIEAVRGIGYRLNHVGSAS